MKKLIEVALPLEAINKASIREKSIRHGHPSTLHLYWARRPLAACRAVLFGQLVDDPSSHPDQFPTHADQERERQRLFAIIEDLVTWENSTNEEVLERARAEIRRSCGGVLPPVYDPFSGGGSIPLEAQRLGLPAYGSDLNPVAVMIGKAMIEIPPKFLGKNPVHPGGKDRNQYRFAEGIAEDVEYYGELIRQRALEELGDLYPPVEIPVGVSSSSTKKLGKVIAWIWVRTVPSPDPAFSDVQVPLLSSFLLSSKKGSEVWIEPIIDRVLKTIEFRIRSEGTNSEKKAAELGATSGKRQGFRCLISDSAITYDYIRRMGQAGRMGARLVAIVADGVRGRVFLSANDQHVRAAEVQLPDWKPSLQLQGKSKVNVGNYGIENFGQLFTNRQLTSLNTLSRLVREIRAEVEADARRANLLEDDVPLRSGGTGSRAYAEAISVYLAFGISRLADISNAHCNWSRSANQAVHLFGRQAIPMVWDFAETGLFSEMAGDYRTSLYSIVKALNRFAPSAVGTQQQCDAQSMIYAEGAVISTDPPYYDNIDYADLSDFFYEFLKKNVGDIYPEIFQSLATPKAEELVASASRYGSKEAAELHFLDGMRQAIKAMADQSSRNFPAAIYYAFKQSEIQEEGISSTGWATFLAAVIEAGYQIVGTWPVRTERDTGLKVSMNVLANSVVIVCRRKQASADVITRAEFIRALKRELPPAIAELQAANIAPADMPQSAIGPGMGVFSRYKSVLESDDSPMTVKAALQLINRELDEYLGGIQGEFDADTRFAITWFEQNGLKAGDYGTANNIATARGISVESVKHAGIVESAAGKVRILKRDEMDAEWEPDADGHLTVWECCQHLVRLHEKYGIGYEAAVMLKKFGPKADDVRDLAYVLYNICEKRGDAKEATAYNALIADWTDLTREAATAPLTNRSGQMRFEV
jgi:putative DNA methylase